MYCQHCGKPLPEAMAEEEIAAEAETKETEDVVDAAVEIARIEADRDVTLARINAGVERQVLDSEREAELAHAEGVVEGVETVLEAAAPDPEPEPVPVIVEAPSETPEADEAPLPPVETIVEPERKRSSNPWW